LSPVETTPLDRCLRDYLASFAERESRGDAREESFYSCFESFLLGCAAGTGRQQVRVTPIPRKTHDCLLDFQVWNASRVAGYVEAKAPGTSLQEAAGSAQVQRYLQTFPNLLLTNFREIRLFRGGAFEEAAEIAPGRAPAVRAVLSRFFDFHGVPGPPSAAWLAGELAARARVLADRVRVLLRDERERGDAPEISHISDSSHVSHIGGLFLAFREFLRASLDEHEFADLYAQTITYGLLAGRLRENRDRGTVLDSVPQGGILRDVFEVISLGQLPASVAWIVEDLLDLLTAAPIQRIVERHFDPLHKDPVQHFYETFLVAYDRGLRKRRGVYYTPRPVVSFIVRSVHALLRSRLGWDDGLADPRVSLLDPAAGTMTFLTEAFGTALNAYVAAHGMGGQAALVRDHLVPHFHAFEVMMAPYAIGHWRARLFFAERGLALAADQRVGLYLTNALEMVDVAQTWFPGTAPLARESHEAWRIKKETPVSVVIGNPPWAGHSKNRSRDIDVLVAESYLRVDGKPLGERNPKWLRDDYVKFLRFAQAKIDQNGEGVLGFVTNHGFIDNPTFRGLRRSLLDTFDEIYVLDLHGNQRKRESNPNGTPEDNVFAGIAQGVAILLAVKKPGLRKRVLHADLRGGRPMKLHRLNGWDVESIHWQETRPRAPSYLFVGGGAGRGLEAEYARGVPLERVFPERSVGVLTARDEAAVGFDRADLEERIGDLRRALRQGGEPPFRLGAERAERVRRLLDEGAWRSEIRDILVRPFDRRVILYADALVDRPRRRGMLPLLDGGNVGLVLPRQARDRSSAFVTDRMIGHKAVSAYDINYVFPLRRSADGLFGGGAPNLAEAVLLRLAETWGEAPCPDAVFAYVYAVLHSPGYRERYAAFLHAGFPRIPFPASPALFTRLAGLGAALVDLHLLRSARLRAPGVPCCGDGAAPVNRRCTFDAAAGRVVVNAAGLAFEGIEREVWLYRIGGQPVLARWLAARAGRRLSLREIEDFQKAAAAVRLTLETQLQIEKVWPQMDETGLVPVH
jgi:Type ISP C-terminal specificity domain/N-6 DNA Methylase